MMWVSSQMEGNKQDGKRVIELQNARNELVQKEDYSKDPPNRC
jgi:hypothetical protein